MCSWTWSSPEHYFTMPRSIPWLQSSHNSNSTNKPCWWLWKKSFLYWWSGCCLCALVYVILEFASLSIILEAKQNCNDCLSQGFEVIYTSIFALWCIIYINLHFFPSPYTWKYMDEKSYIDDSDVSNKWKLILKNVHDIQLKL